MFPTEPVAFFRNFDFVTLAMLVPLFVILLRDKQLRSNSELHSISHKVAASKQSPDYLRLCDEYCSTSLLLLYLVLVAAKYRSTCMVIYHATTHLCLRDTIYLGCASTYIRHYSFGGSRICVPNDVRFVISTGTIWYVVTPFVSSDDTNSVSRGCDCNYNHLDIKAKAFLSDRVHL